DEYHTRIREKIQSLGCEIGTQILPLGYIGRNAYLRILKNARAVVMPTLVEGGGSYPVEEALYSGIPVICSDIPVMREHMDRVGGRPIWFKSDDPGSLAAAIVELDENYDRHRAEVVTNSKKMRRFPWKEIASGYWRYLAQD